MIRGTKAIGAFLVAAIITSSLTLPACSQGFGKRGGGPGSGYPIEKHPPVDEKAYKAALERIPTPDRKYDPWGIARPAEPVTTKKSN
jgi:hypothetical protein